ncbi:MAG: metallophosphoesterase [Clostridiales Family XIII bacterium]|nr:metallophosphoesterase [Clostridiales Family XIII bacterium]
MARIGLRGRAGMTIKASSGLEELGHAGRMSTVFFYEAAPGDRLTLLDSAYLFNVATYAPAVDIKYIYTYAYQPDESWTSYNGDLSGDTYTRGPYVFSERVYFRVCLKRADGADFGAGDDMGSILGFDSALRRGRVAPGWIDSEAEAVAGRVRAAMEEGSKVFGLLADTHMTVNGTWDDTADALRRVSGRVAFDGIIHLGDLTDGMVTAEATRAYAGRMIDDLRGMGAPLYVAVGNHDTNYFGGNAEPFSEDELCSVYLGHSDAYTARAPGKPYYYADIGGLRLIVLDSYDREDEIRYGFSDGCAEWLEAVLASTPHDIPMLVLSHITPLAPLQFWASSIRNGDRVFGLIEGHSRVHGNVLGYINGHNHADQVYSGASFPIVSVGCAKLEYFEGKKPAGSTAPARKPGDRTQELWDVLVVSPGGRLDFIRYGAGSDRRVCAGARPTVAGQKGV